MTSALTGIFGELGHILGLCRCGTIFYLSETRPYLTGKRPKSIVDALRAAESKLDRQDEKLGELEDELREIAAKAGLRTAKKILKKIDPTFTGAGYDPQDVKVIFNPVTYIVFDGLARDKLNDIVLMAKPPTDTFSERIQKTIGQAIKKGNVEFKTLHVDAHKGHVTAR